MFAKYMLFSEYKVANDKKSKSRDDSVHCNIKLIVECTIAFIVSPCKQHLKKLAK